ncbi:MAG: SDR family oxidoreductase [Alphaproteobacteria bacterium]|nr:SDR family oxidoreductase [Alphaproteobacteria bacterium]
MTPSARYPSLAGRGVFISGGGSGIGAALTARFAEQGARVGFVDLQDDVSQALAAKTGARYWRCDVRDTAAYQAIIREADRTIGPLRVLVNNAARDDRHAWDSVTPEYWDEIEAVNLKHHFFAIQAAAPLMAKAGGGSIVNLGSVSWMRRTPGMVAYTTAKAAINGLTRTMARELGPLGIRVNALVPGAIMTERQRKLWLTPELERSFLDAQVLKFLLEPDHVAAMALFLAADDSAGCSGQNFIVDGGIS